MGWGTFLAAIAGPVAKRLLMSLGFGFITIAGFTAVKSQISNAVSSALGGVAGSVYQVISLAGLIDAIGIWLGAISTVLVLLTMKKLGVMSS